MKMVCISKNNDIAIGLRLAGIQSFFIENNDEIIEKIKNLAKDNSIGILNITEDVYNIAKKELDEIMEKQDLPLIVKVPNTK